MSSAQKKAKKTPQQSAQKNKSNEKLKQKQIFAEDEDFSDAEEQKFNSAPKNNNITIEEQEEVSDDAEYDRSDKRAGAWHDSDDDELAMDLQATARTKKLKKSKDETVISGNEYRSRLEDYYKQKASNSSFYDWAQGKKDGEEEEDGENKQTSYLDSILQTNTNFIDQSLNDYLPSQIIKMNKVAALPEENRHKAIIQTIDFYRDSSMVLTGAMDKTIKIFNLSRTFENSNKYELKPLKNIALTNLPILTAKFNPTDSEVIATGLKKYILSFDLVKETFEKSAPAFITSRLDGRIRSFEKSSDDKLLAIFGHNQYIMICSAQTKQLLYEFRLNAKASACCFSNDNKYLFATTEDGSIYQWDLSSRKIVDIMTDVGSMNTNCLHCSEDGSYLATGNNAGLTNLYSFNKVTKTLNKKPVKEIDNLTTSIDDVAFNPAGEILAFASKWKKNSIRLFHMSTNTVFQNWPNMRTKLGLIQKIKFSPNNKYLAIGNDLGNLIVYNFEHYNNQEQ